MKLFEERGATFNPARTHRQKLWRIWDRKKPLLICIGMNPSKSDKPATIPQLSEPSGARGSAARDSLDQFEKS
ncbi:MAG: DUF1643 domain-containing protein [Pseudomonadota bacterium]